MAQTGEDKELVLGNKQLISLFFVVVALCGVFFAMGYMIARNSGKTTLSSDATTQTTSPAATVVTRQQPEPPRETAADPGATAPPADPPTQPQVDTKPALEPSASQTTPPDPGGKDTRGVSATEAGASYLQVTALPRSDADGVVKTLRDQNFPVILASSSKDGLYRVLVGPYRQTAELADAKSRLKTMGFGSAFVQKQ